MVYSAVSDDVGTISQFTRRKKITITTGGTSTPALYQVLVTIAYELEMQANFQDVRFNTKAGTYIDYWIESKTAGVTANIWLELPDAITDPGSDYIWMYYGNAGLSDGGDIGDTFLFGDDFSGDLSKWTEYDTGANVAIVSGRLRVTGNNSWNANGAVTTSSFARPIIIEWKEEVSSNLITVQVGYMASFLVNSGIEFYTTLTGTATNALIDGASQASVSTVLGEIPMKLIIKPTSGYSWYYNNVLLFDTSSGTYDNYVFGIMLCNYPSIYTYLDDVRIRKYISNEPTPSYGTAQHQRRVPIFL